MYPTWPPPAPAARSSVSLVAQDEGVALGDHAGQGVAAQRAFQGLAVGQGRPTRFSRSRRPPPPILNGPPLLSRVSASACPPSRLRCRACAGDAPDHRHLCMREPFHCMVKGGALDPAGDIDDPAMIGIEGVHLG